ncbi:hypothetical protein TRFO_16118 [Tritrichomonas foetus]|uniref:Uncharacterized protein n=1 Tax=Tritrichomonas foetus TaxID=1144522 RepID=A0A1J4KR04_9EUKA|nr:hypothetical protein TRFO_16118 [Tritrichomonas foetus]|eukprot:OHT13683.1 hypothetical protein TRFO_16118 [Tritrichomonas foetus]
MIYVHGDHNWEYFEWFDYKTPCRDLFEWIESVNHSLKPYTYKLDLQFNNGQTLELRRDEQAIGNIHKAHNMLIHAIMLQNTQIE